MLRKADKGDEAVSALWLAGMDECLTKHERLLMICPNPSGCVLLNFYLYYYDSR
jgi:hypothetical protein